jgi:glycine/D-amino acid oxidase-like deaminating enzyme
MGPQVDSVNADLQAPPRGDVVIVGGGIVGTSAALFLAEKGVSVVLCEKGHIAGEQSSRNWGWCRKARRDPRELPLIIESMRLWQGMNERVGAETGFRTSGIVFAAESDADLARYESWLEHARLYQLDTKLVSAAELEQLMPGTSGRWKAALYSPSDGRAEPQKGDRERADRRSDAVPVLTLHRRLAPAAYGRHLRILPQQAEKQARSAETLFNDWDELRGTTYND